MNDKLILSEDKIAFIQLAFEGKKKERTSLAEMFDELKKHYSTELLSSINETVYSSTSSFNETACLIFKKMEILLNWPSIIGKNIVGIVAKDNTYSRSFIKKITGGALLPELNCPMIISPRKECRDYFLNGKHTGITILEEETLNTFSLVAEETKHIDAFIDSVEFPYGVFDNLVFVVAPKSYWDNNQIWDDVIHQWVIFSLDENLMKKNKKDTFLFFNSSHIKKTENITCCRKISSKRIVEWLNKNNKKVWRNCYYDEFVHLFFTAEVNISRKMAILKSFVDQYNKDNVMGIPIDSRLCQQVLTLSISAQEKREHFHKSYSLFLRKLNELIAEIRANNISIEETETDTDNDLLLEISIMAHELEFSKEYKKYKEILQKNNCANLFLLNLYEAMEDEILYNNQCLPSLKKADNTNLLVKRTKVKFAEQIELSEEDRFALLLDYENEVDLLDSVENELLGDYYFKLFQDKYDETFLDNAKNYWEEAFLQGSTRAGNKLYKNFGQNDEKYREFLAMQGEDLAIKDMSLKGVNDKGSRFYIKYQAAKEDIFSLFLLAEYEFGRLPKLNNVEDLSAYIQDKKRNINNTLLVNIQEMYEVCYKNWSKLKKIPRDEQHAIKRSEVAEKLGILYFLSSLDKNEHSSKYVKNAKNYFKTSESAIGYYWLGILTLEEANTNNLSIQKAKLEEAKNLFIKALDLKNNYNAASEKLADIETRLVKIEEQLCPPPPPSSSGSSGSFCVPANAIVTLPSGDKIKINEILKGDKVLAFNHYTGKLEYTKVFANIQHNAIAEDFSVIKLIFSDTKYTSFVEAHCYYDATLSKYMTINCNNVQNFLNHEFLIVENMQISKVRLLCYEIEVQNTKLYEIVTEKNINFIVDGVISASVYMDKLLNIFEFLPDSYMYNPSQIIEGIKKIGYAEKDDFPMLLSEYFEIANGRYFNLAINLGTLTEKDICDMICLADKYLT